MNSPLDDPALHKNLDPQGMLDQLARFPQQCRDALALKPSPALAEEFFQARQMLCAGMGGSGLMGELLQRLLDVPAMTVKGYDYPSHLDPAATLILAISYSGDTEETLSLLQQGLKRGARALTISSGGQLQRVAEEENIAHILIPVKTLQPRAALAYLLFPLLRLFAQAGLYSGPPLDESIEVLQTLRDGLGPHRPCEKNQAKQLAHQLHRKIPIIYGLEGLSDAAAYRWKTQINENSKQPAFWHALPELCHNEIVALEMGPRLFPNSCVIFLRQERSTEHPRIARRIEFYESLLREKKLDFAEVWARGESTLEQLLSLIYVGDFVSLYLALLNGVDPAPVQLIARLKEYLREGDS